MVNGTTAIPTSISATARDIMKNFVKYLCLDFVLSLRITIRLRSKVAKMIKTAVTARPHLSISESKFATHWVYISSQEELKVVMI